MNKAHKEKLKRIYTGAHPMIGQPIISGDLDNYTPEDWKEYLKSQKLVAAKHLVEEVQNGKVTAIETFYKLLGEFIEKSEQVRIELSAADYIKIDRESDRKIREALGEAGGGESLPKEPSLLSN